MEGGIPKGAGTAQCISNKVFSVLKKVGRKKAPENLMAVLNREIQELLLVVQICLSRLLKLNHPEIYSKDCNFGLKKEKMLVFFQC